MTNLSKDENRISVADGLRGFAILAITLLHSINHFNLYLFPEHSLPFFEWTDPIIRKIVSSVSSGKSYGVFALLFGFTFYLQLSNQNRRGEDFHYRFIWRMFILFVIGTLNSAFFAGEILVLYSLVGLTLVPIRHLRDRHLLAIAALFLLQPILLAKITYILLDQNYTQNFERYAPDQLFIRLENDPFIQMLRTNLTLGKQVYWMSIISNGERIFQAIALFISGMLLGRNKLFKNTVVSKEFWNKTFIISVLSFLILKFARYEWKSIIDPGPLGNMVENILTLWTDFALVAFIAAVFMKIYTGRLKNAVSWLEPIGKMSLTNYVLQSVVGSFLFYGYGLALSRQCGVTTSFLTGLLIAALQFCFSTWWLKHHAKGPLEQLWHYLTWIRMKKHASKDA